MDDNLSQKTKTETSEEPLNIHDCLKMIGMKEVAANVYTFPSKKEKEQED